MDPNALRDHLTKLHDELKGVARVDAGSTQLLGQILQDIKRLVDEPAVTTTQNSLPDRLEQIAVQFEAEHPTLAASSRRLIDLLGKAGL